MLAQPAQALVEGAIATAKSTKLAKIAKDAGIEAKEGYKVITRAG